MASVHESIDTRSPMGRAFFAIVAVLNALEREQTAERTSEAMLVHQRNGRRMTRADRIPYGWELDPESPLGRDGKPAGIRECPYEQGIIRQIVASGNMGFSPTAIIRVLESKGVDYRGGKWHPDTIKRILLEAQATA